METYTREQLEALSDRDLMELGCNLGVRGATSMSSDDLLMEVTKHVGDRGMLVQGEQAPAGAPKQKIRFCYASREAQFPVGDQPVPLGDLHDHFNREWGIASGTRYSVDGEMVDMRTESWRSVSVRAGSEVEGMRLAGEKAAA